MRMADFQVAYDDARNASAYLRTGQNDLEEDEPTMPSSVNGGDGEEYILSMITQLAEEAGTIAMAAELGASNMDKAVDLVSGVDEGVAQEFKSMEGYMNE